MVRTKNWHPNRDEARGAWACDDWMFTTRSIFFFGRLGPTFGSKMKLGSTDSIAVLFNSTFRHHSDFQVSHFFQIRDPIVFLRKNSQKNNLASGFPVTLLFERSPRNSELKKVSEPNLFPAT